MPPKAITSKHVAGSFPIPGDPIWSLSVWWLPEVSGNDGDEPWIAPLIESACKEHASEVSKVTPQAFGGSGRMFGRTLAGARAWAMR